ERERLSCSGVAIPLEAFERLLVELDLGRTRGKLSAPDRPQEPRGMDPGDAADQQGIVARDGARGANDEHPIPGRRTVAPGRGDPFWTEKIPRSAHDLRVPAAQITRE